MKISNIQSIKILNSRSKWTIETALALEDGSIGVASVPEGVSKGKTEAVSLPVKEAIFHISRISQDLYKQDFKNQEDFDKYLIKLDGTPNKSNLGGNTTLCLSIAFAKASAVSKNIPPYTYFNSLWGMSKKYTIPKMMMLMLEGGKHGSGDMSIQEFMYLVDTLKEGNDLYDKVRGYLSNKNLPIEVGLEGAFSPKGVNNIKALDILAQISPNTPICLDVAFSSKDLKKLDYKLLTTNYKLISIEDPFGEEDWKNWSQFNKKYGDTILVVGDDLTTTNRSRIEKAVNLNAINAIIIKPNQIGTISESINAVSYSQKNGLKIIVSHRSGETNDDYIADFAVGVGADYVKFGSPSRGERVAKYNRLLAIEKFLRNNPFKFIL